MHMQMGDPSKDGRNVEGRRMLVVDVGVGWVLRNGCVCAVCLCGALATYSTSTSKLLAR